jgi:arylsulfatase A-like enzyme
MYSTDYIDRLAVRFIRRHRSDGPWLLYLFPAAPHAPFLAPPRDRNADVPPPTATPAITEKDRSDKPPYVRSREPSRASNAIRREQLRTLPAVDDLVANVAGALAETAQESRTLAVFTSDNGYLWGEHGLVRKGYPYTRSIKVPLLVRWPGWIDEPATDDRLVANIDLAPTFADLGKAKAPSFVDGRSLAPALREKSGDDTRTGLLVEHFAPSDRNARAGRRGGGAPPTYAALRTDRYTYVEYVTGERQLYDLRADPDQLHNIVSTADPKLVKELAEQLASLRTCEARSCRVADRR